MCGLKRPTMKKILFAFSLLALFILLSSHEFWLQPNKYIYDRGEEINIRFIVGEDFEGENWQGDSSRINNLIFYYGGVKDIISPNFFAEKGDSLQLRQYDEGTSMVTYNSKNSFITLNAKDFNEYLEEEELTDAVEYRKQHDETDSSGYEFYQRSIKTIFQVGNIKDETYKLATSLPLDIIPLSHPYKISDGDSLTVKIIFKGKPLTNAIIKVWNRRGNETLKWTVISDKKGLIKFPVATKGEWMVSCVKIVRIYEPPTNWQSYWGNCTWGYY
ncbi:MAG: DUF4198 domain-containing protein [Bacteroidetes bacterium]|nr:MAG: DUF4198 domain-containing protein [Bacteroidota bacterium]